jgi:serine phosphatase RsbU (regulator of sigma subunit)
MVTDGVTEAESPAGEIYGDERLKSSSALRMSAEQILASVRLFCAPRPMNDDCTVVSLDYLGNGSGNRLNGESVQIVLPADERKRTA